MAYQRNLFQCNHTITLVTGILLLMYLNIAAVISLQCSSVDLKHRFDCNPEPNPSQVVCQERGCCWAPVATAKYEDSKNPPSCFYPSDYPTYAMGSPVNTPYGYSVTLKRTTPSYYPRDVALLQMDVYLETNYRLHFKIYDPNSERYEVPIPTPYITKRSATLDYKVQFSDKPMGIQVIRVLGGTVLFNSSVNTLIFSDQFIQLSTSLASPYIYGLGEHRGSFRLGSNWNSFNLWDRDQSPEVNANLYGAHPFYLNVEGPSGRAYGVFLLNSNAMNIEVQPSPAVTYRTIGGILDFYIFLGPGPDQVIQQYTEVIGRPFMPPYWSLGFHLCRYGYGSSNRTLEVNQRMREAKIPQDGQWNDIDAMDKFKDFTYDKITYKGLPDMIKFIHDNGQHYVTLLDPVISNSQPAGTYPPYDSGLAQDVFIKWDNGTLVVGKVIPGTTVFPDFSKESTKSWWGDCIEKFHKEIDFDGMWIDMNSPTNFADTGCPNTTYDYPPYVPKISGGTLQCKTLCPSAVQSLGRHYNLHNIYGYSETLLTYGVLVKLLKKRPFTTTRTNFAGSGKYGGHWLGDNHSSWSDMAYSIPELLSMNLFGVPLVGSDICGFMGETTEELCQRWHQLGAFYPFSRNQNNIATKKAQDPTEFSPAMQASTRKALNLRYALLPYFYTLFHLAHVQGSTVARPLFFEYPGDAALFDIERQFMLGPALLVTPVLTQGATSVSGTFPKGIWYDIAKGGHFESLDTSTFLLDAALDEINVHLRQGCILPTQLNYTDITTTAQRQRPFTIVVPLGAENTTGGGELFWDDGDSLDTYEMGQYISLVFTSSDNGMNSTVLHDGYSGSHDMILESVIVMGVAGQVTMVTVNGTGVDFAYDAAVQNIHITKLRVPMMYPFNVRWTY